VRGWRRSSALPALRMAEAVQLLNLVAAGVLTGNELGTWAVVHPAVQKLPFAEEVRSEQEITRRYGYFMPGLMLLTIVSGFVAGGLVESGDRGLVLAGSTCYAAMLAITLTGNVPINVRTLQFARDGDEHEWRRLRRRWDLLHLARIVLDVAGFALLACAAVS
jgi:Domain of unknown function (DUF1772)